MRFISYCSFFIQSLAPTACRDRNPERVTCIQMRAHYGKRVEQGSHSILFCKLRANIQEVISISTISTMFDTHFTSNKKPRMRDWRIAVFARRIGGTAANSRVPNETH